MTHLILKLLSTYEVMVGGKVVTHFRSIKEQALLAYLVVETEQTHSREKLSGLLWPERSESIARRNLSQTLLNLRKAIGDPEAQPPYLLATRRAIHFNAESHYHTDITTLTTELKYCNQHQHTQLSRCQVCSPHLQKIAQLYQGAFLDGFSVPDSHAFETWRMLKQTWLQAQVLDCLEHLADYFEWQEDFQTAYQYAWRQHEIDSLREVAYRRLMRVLWLDGQRSQALQQYEICRETLETELGITPDEKTIALYQKIKRSDSQEREKRRNSPAQMALPIPTTPLIGRKPQLQKLKALLLDANYRLVTIVGQGGMGKTRLSLETAVSLADHFAQGACFVPLAGVQPAGQPTTAVWHHILATAIAEVMGFTFTGPQDPPTQLYTYLQQKHLLLVLDNFEHLITGVSFITRLLQQAPHITILVTSREVLNLQAEYALYLAGLPVPPIQQHAPQYASVQLFVERADRTPMGFSLHADNLPHVIDICQLVDGNPLAIELAATWVRMLTCQDIAQEIRHNLDFLETAMHELPKRHRSMRAVFENSWKRMTTKEQTLFCQLAIFRGGFEYKAMQEIVQPARQDWVALLEKSLVTRQTSTRFEMHELVRQFAEAKAAHNIPPPPSAIYKRHSNYYLNFVQQQSQQLGTEESQQAIHSFQRDFDNIRQAWEWALNQANPATACHSLVALTQFLMLLGLYREGESLLAKMIKRIRTTTDQLPEPVDILAPLLSRQAEFLNGLGQHDAAILIAQEIVQQSQQNKGHEHMAVLGHLRWGEALWYQGEVTSALPHLQQAWQQSQRMNAPHIEADCLMALGSAVLRQGDNVNAQNYYKHALHLAQKIQDLHRECQAVRNLGAVTRNLGHLAQAQGYYERSLQLARKVGDRDREGATFNNLGDMLLNQGLYEEAINQYQQGLAIFQEMGNRRSESIILTNLGRIFRDLGLYDEAQHYFAQAAPIYQKIGFKRGYAWMLSCSALANIQQQIYGLARQESSEAYYTFEALGDRLGMTHALTCLGHALTGLAYKDEAAVSFQKAIQLRQEMGQDYLIIEPMAGLAHLTLHTDDVVRAKQYVDKILPYLVENRLANIDDPLFIYDTCYQVLTTTGDVSANVVAKQREAYIRQRLLKINDDRLHQALLNKIDSSKAKRSKL